MLPTSLWGFIWRIRGPLDTALDPGVGPKPLVGRRQGGSRACSTKYEPEPMRTPQIWTELGYTVCSHVDTFAFSHEYILLFFFSEPGRIRMLLPVRELTPQRTKEQFSSHSGGNSMPPSQWDALYC